MIKKIIAFFFVCLMISSHADARIYILIDQLSDKKFPIAVPRFVTPKGSSAGGISGKMLALLQKDLRLSGMFQVLDDGVLPQKDKDVNKINFAKWDAIEVGALVKGVVSKGKGGTTIQLKLYDVGEKSMIMGKQYTVTSKNYVDATHKFVDSLMESLTGIKGPFHSKIVGACGRAPKRSLGVFEMDGSRRGGMAKSGMNAVSPAWSPSGNRVAYTAFTKDNSIEVFVGRKQVTHFRSTTITPSWTPDGKLIVASSKSGISNLYLINLNGKILRQLTNTRSIDFNPSISSSGRVVFSSERAGGLQLFVTGTGGGGAGQLTYTGYQNDQPDWAPDGSKVVFSGKDKGAFDIFIMDSDGSNILRLTREEGNNESPTFAPDGRYIAYHSTRGGGGIFVMLEDGTNQFMIEKSSSCINLDWGPRLK